MAPNKVHLHFNPIARLIHTSELKGQRQYCPTKSMCASLNIRNCLKAQFRSQSMAGCCGVTEHESCGSNSTAEPWRWGRAWKQTWKLHKICCEGCCKICSSIFSSAAHTHTLRLNIQIEPKKHALIYTITPTHKHLLGQVCCTKGWLYNTTHFNHQSG